jgi:hypothetical protein
MSRMEPLDATVDHVRSDPAGRLMAHAGTEIGAIARATLT